MPRKEAARRRLQHRRAYMSNSADMDILSEFERACWLLVPTFGAMWALIALLVVSGVVR